MTPAIQETLGDNSIIPLPCLNPQIIPQLPLAENSCK